MTSPENPPPVADKEGENSRPMIPGLVSVTFRQLSPEAIIGLRRATPGRRSLKTRASHSDHAGFFEPNDIRHCLYAAGYLNACCRMGEILEVANFYSLVNTMGIVHVHAGQVRMSEVDFVPVVADDSVTLPPMSLVRVTCGNER